MPATDKQAMRGAMPKKAEAKADRVERKQAGKQGTSGPAASDALAVVLVRGLIGSRSDIRDTLVMLRLLRKNACILVPDTPGVCGMLQKAKDYITWGKIDQETRKKLEAQKKVGSVSPVFHLHPPRKGFGRKGVKRGFATGGALGDRGEKINDLLQRML